MKAIPRFKSTLASTVLLLTQFCISHSTHAAGPVVSFSLDVQPILASHCGECHRPGGAGYEASGLDLRNYAGLMQGTRFGAVVKAGDPVSSTLIRLVEGRADPSLRMPHGQRRPLLKQQISILSEWVRLGAKDN